MTRRSAFIQIRVTPREKATLKELARSSGQDLSSYMLSRSLPSNRLRFQELLQQLGRAKEPGFVLAELNELLANLAPMELPDAVEGADLSGLSSFAKNYVAAMVEHASSLKGVDPPSWTRSVAPLERPFFASPLRAHRLHLLRASPVVYKRRNIFVDSGVGARV